MVRVGAHVRDQACLLQPKPARYFLGGAGVLIPFLHVSHPRIRFPHQRSRNIRSTKRITPLRNRKSPFIYPEHVRIFFRRGFEKGLLETTSAVPSREFGPFDACHRRIAQATYHSGLMVHGRSLWSLHLIKDSRQDAEADAVVVG